MLHDAGGAIRLHTAKGVIYCYMIGWGPDSCFLGNVSVLLFCLYVKRKIFPAIHFKMNQILKSISLIELHVELTKKNVIKKLRHFIDGIFPGIPFVKNLQT